MIYTVEEQGMDNAKGLFFKSSFLATFFLKGLWNTPGAITKMVKRLQEKVGHGKRP